MLVTENVPGMVPADTVSTSTPGTPGDAAGKLACWGTQAMTRRAATAGSTQVQPPWATRHTRKRKTGVNAWKGLFKVIARTV